MKFSYALIKKLLPGAPNIRAVADKLNTYSFEVEAARGDMLEVKLPANIYSYAAAHIGLAREVGVILGKKFTSPVRQLVNIPAGRGTVRVKIEEKELCLRYAARVLEVSQVSSFSPAHIRKVLATCGINSVNHIVDLMNYVMLETGQPLHAFDFDKVADGRGRYADKHGQTRTAREKNSHSPALTVRRARRGEKLETLDGQTPALTPEMLVIADASRALALAGIKGGRYAGVTIETGRVIVEAANFDQGNIYQTADALGMRTDASIRFAHGLSPALVTEGLDRATQLLTAAGARLIDSVNIYPRPLGEGIIDFDPTRYERFIGAPISLAAARKTFSALGFMAEAKKNKTGVFLRVHIPAWRTDIDSFADLAEEAARLFGYTKLPPRPPVVHLKTAAQDDSIVLKDRLRSLLADFQLDEVYLSSFAGEKEREYPPVLFLRDAVPIEVKNPIAADKKYVRWSLLPHLVTSVRNNARFFETVRIFEIGQVAVGLNGVIIEKTALGIVIASKNDPKVILELKGLVDECVRSLGITDGRFVTAGDVLRIESGGRVLGRLQLIELPKGWLAAAGELDIAKLLQLVESTHEFRPLSKYPAVQRDISVVVARMVRIGDILQCIQTISPMLVDNVDLIDEYSGESLSEDKQSLTFRIVFQAADRTLTDAEVNKQMEKIALALQIGFTAQIR